MSLLTSVGVILWRLPEFQGGWELYPLARLVLTASFPLTVFFRLIFFIRPYIYASYTPKQTHLLVKRRGKVQHFDYSQISHVQKSWLPMSLGGGLTLHFKSGHSLRIFSLIDGHEEIIKDYLNFLPDNLVPQQLRDYYSDSAKIRFRRERMLESLKNWKAGILIYLLYPTGLSAVYHYWGKGWFENGSWNILLGTTAGLFTATLFWFLQESLISFLSPKQRMAQLELTVQVGGRLLFFLALPFLFNTL